MLILESMVQRDFFFNGHWLSEFEGDIGGASAKPLNILPQKEIISEPVLGLDGDVFIKSKYQPRTFSVPIKFENMRRLREISSWLSVKEPKDFYFKGDTVKIKAIVDNLVDVELYGYEGLVELNFVAHDPYFRAIEDRIFTFTNMTRVEVNNEGNCESYPLYKIKGKNIITIGIEGKDVFKVKLDSTGNDYIYVDTYNCTCYNGNVNRINDFDGQFKPINDKYILYGVVGECSEFEVNCRSRWI